MGEYKGFPNIREWFERVRGKGKFYYSKEQDNNRYQRYMESRMIGDFPPEDLPQAVLDDGQIVEYTEVFFDDPEDFETKTLASYKKRFSDAVYLGRGKRLVDCVKDTIIELENDFK